MSFLLDTHVLLWAAGVPDRLPADARTLIENPATELIYSVASLWEVAVKNELGRADFSVDPSLLRRGLLENGYTELAVTGSPCSGCAWAAADPQGFIRPPPGRTGSDGRGDAGDGG